MMGTGNPKYYIVSNKENYMRKLTSAYFMKRAARSKSPVEFVEALTALFFHQVRYAQYHAQKFVEIL